MMTIEPAAPEEIYAVALNMRQADYDEFMAVSYASDREELATALQRNFRDRVDVLCGHWLGEPVCIGGFVMARPNVISLLFFATDDFPRIGLGITKFIKRRLFPRLVQDGVHRFEAVSLATHSEAHAWLRTLGLQQETAPMLGYGKAGQPFIQFAKVTHAGAAG